MFRFLNPSTMAAIEVANILLNAGAMIAAENIPYRKFDSTVIRMRAASMNAKTPMVLKSGV